MVSIDPAKTLIAFLVVIFFIIMFDYTTEILEFFLKDSIIYSKIVQSIYKELMIMGNNSILFLCFDIIIRIDILCRVFGVYCASYRDNQSERIN